MSCSEACRFAFKPCTWMVKLACQESAILHAFEDVDSFKSAWVSETPQGTIWEMSSFLEGIHLLGDNHLWKLAFMLRVFASQGQQFWDYARSFQKASTWGTGLSQTHPTLNIDRFLLSKRKNPIPCFGTPSNWALSRHPYPTWAGMELKSIVGACRVSELKPCLSQGFHSNEPVSLGVQELHRCKTISDGSYSERQEDCFKFGLTYDDTIIIKS